MDESGRRDVVLHFVAPDADLHAALIPLVIEEPGTALSDGSLLDIEADAIVSPGNSFGFMDGGLDARLVERYGSSMQQLVNLQLQRDWDGELPVGCALSVSLPGSGPGWLIVAPTMRVPMRLPRDSVNPYLAVRAVVREAGRIAGSRAPSQASFRVAMPGMGTGIGGVSPANFARQVRAALRSLRTPSPGDWWEASRRHQLLTGPVVRDLQQPAGERTAPYEPGLDALIVEDSIDALGDRVLALVTSDDSGLIVCVHEDDGFEVRNVEVIVPASPPVTPARLADQFAEGFLGRGRDLLERVRQMPGAQERAWADGPAKDDRTRPG
jgi:O-acetyl-ADP-ribose deacetylase (regulator of RNase III)